MHPNNPPDSSTLTQWVEAHADYLFNYALRQFSDEDIAQELVQETFLAAVKSLERFRGEASPRTWLTSILRFKIIDRLRSKSRERIDDSMSEFFDDVEHWRIETGPLPWDTDPENVSSQREFMTALESCLKNLPERHRQIFLLREIDDLDQEELCNQLALSPTNLRVILCRSRVVLRECLQQNWFRPTRRKEKAQR